MTILASDKACFKGKKVHRDKKGPYVTIKGSIHQDDIAILNACAPNKRASKYLKQKLTEVVRNRQFLNDTSRLHHPPHNWQKSQTEVCKDTENLSDTNNQEDWVDVYRNSTWWQQNTHSFPEASQNIQRDIPYPGSYNKLWQI